MRGEGREKGKAKVNYNKSRNYYQVQRISHPESRCPTVSNETVCASKEQGSIANTDYPIGAGVAFKCAVSMCECTHAYVCMCV